MTIEIKWQHQKWCCHFYDYLAGWNLIDHLYTSDYNKIRERDKGENVQKICKRENTTIIQLSRCSSWKQWYN